MTPNDKETRQGDLDPSRGEKVLGISGSRTESNRDRRPLTEVYRVFSRPRTTRDRRAGELAERLAAFDQMQDANLLPERPSWMSDEAWQDARRETTPGRVLDSEGRIVLTELGGDEDMLYAAPTENGFIYQVLLPSGEGACGAGGQDGLHLNWTYLQARTLLVYGLVSDEIHSVDIVVGGQAYPARMGENAFGSRIDAAEFSTLEKVVLHRHDGSQREIVLG